MLVLSRRPGESIVIELPTGEQIEVTVLTVDGRQVRLGTEAPEQILVLREELLERSPARLTRDLLDLDQF